MTLGEYIDDYLKKEHISISEFARRCDVSKAYISMIIKGRNPTNGELITPSIKIMDKLAQQMHISLDDLCRTVEGYVSLSDNPEKYMNKRIDILDEYPDVRLDQITQTFNSRKEFRALFIEADRASVEEIRIAVSVLRRFNTLKYGEGPRWSKDY